MSEKYTFIEAENATVAGETACAPTVTQMCSWLQVSRSGFYEWRSRPDSAAARRRDDLKLLIAKAFEDSDGTYGYRRVALQLARWGVRAGLELVRGLMRELGLVPASRGPGGRRPPSRARPGRSPILWPVTLVQPLPGRKWSAILPTSDMAGVALSRDGH